MPRLGGGRHGTNAASLGLLALVSLVSRVSATYWTATSWYAVSFSTTIIGQFTDVYTSEYYVKATVTPTATPLSTSTEVYGFEDLTLVYAYIPYDALPASDLLTPEQALSTITSSNDETEYVIPAVYTAPTTCKTPFTVTTQMVVFPPDLVTNQLKPTSTFKSVNSLNTNQPMTYYTMYLSPGAVPTSTGADYIYSDYIASCLNPTATGANFFNGGGSSYRAAPTKTGGADNSGGSSGSSSSGSGLDDIGVCSLLTGCTTLRTWIIVVATLIPALFVFGWIESFLWFRRMMLGKSALRVGTVCWICISLWMLCFTRTAHTRSAEDQVLLRQQWRAMSGGTRWKLWWKWGFRHAYPVALLGDPKTGGVPVQQQQGNNDTPGSYGYPGGQPPAPGAPGGAVLGADPYGYAAQQKDQATSYVQQQQQQPGVPYDPNWPQQGYFPHPHQGGILPVDAQGQVQPQYSEADSRQISPPVYEAPADSVSPTRSDPSSVISPMTAVHSPPIGGFHGSPIHEQQQQQQQQPIYEAPDGTVHQAPDGTPRHLQQPPPQ